MIQYAFDMETLELFHELEDQYRLKLVHMVLPGREQQANFSEEVERELRSNDEIWKRLCIDNKLRGILTSKKHQEMVRRILSFQPDLINPNHYRGQTIPFSMSIASCEELKFVYPFTHLRLSDLKPIIKCLKKFKIDYADTADVLVG